MVKNKHQGMQLKKFWFKTGELNKLINAIEGNEKDLVFAILFEINKRGDFEQ